MWNQMKDKISTQLKTAENYSGKVMNQIRGVEETKDEVFNATRLKFEKHAACLKLMYEAFKANSSALAGLGKAIHHMGKQVCIFSGEEKRVPLTAEITLTCESLSNSVLTYLEKIEQVTANLKQMILQVDQVHKRILERDNALVEFDKQKYELSNESKKPNNPHIAVVEKRYEAARVLFEQRNTDTIREIETMYNSRNLIVELRLFFDGSAQFYQNASRIYADIAQKFANVTMNSSNLPTVSMQPNRIPPTTTSTTTNQSPVNFIPTANSTFQPVAPVQRPPVQATTNIPMNSNYSAVPPPVIATSTTTTTVKRARALYPFTAEQNTELSFRPGEVMTIIDDSDSSWWICELNNRRGEVPVTYVERI
eukprot:TRINITY_DN615_c3_g1_i1.p1 TRINITY_DN615_c3_g1~~TRINITY_DN615_c3_g1_i1.p1  ORF type:complete len:367 (+),score=172.97 TRINITY_DN615_c3_g1_i1:60-1160(+)